MSLFEKYIKNEPMKSGGESENKNFKYLDDLINSGLQEIILDCNIVLDSNERNIYKNGISIERDNIVIDCNYHYIDSNSKTHIFQISSENVIIKHAIFKNSFDKKGGVINNKKNNITLIDCIFENNSSRLHGGTIYNTGNSFKLLNCIFKNNFARGYGGVIYNDGGSMVIEECIFEENSSRKYGGVIFNNSSLSLIKSKFNNNSSESHAAVIYNEEGSITFETCEFDNNSAEKHGGVIYNSNGSLNCINSYFTNNTAKVYGGVFYNAGLLDCSECNFKKNSAVKLGDVIWSNAKVNIFKSNFEDNNSDKNCTYIFQELSDSESIIKNSSFLCDNIKDSNIIRIDDGFCLIDHDTFDINDTSGDGNIIYNKNGEVTIDKLVLDDLNQKCIFNDNILKIKNADGIIDKISEGVNSLIKESQDKLPADWKGFEYLNYLISNYSGVEIKLNQDIVMHESENDFFEGGIEIPADGITIDGQGHIIDAQGFSRIFFITGKNICLKNIKFYNGKYYLNHLDSDLEGGGAITVLHDSSVEIINCEFKNNESRNSAGVICNKGELTISDKAEFSNNMAKRNSGVISNYGGKLFLKGNCKFFNNNSDEDGGVIYNNGYLEISDNCEFLNNASNKKGGVIFNNSKIELSDSILKDNSANEGGVIYNICDDRLIFDNCLFEKNTASSGGAIVNYGSLSLIGCDFNDNQSTYKGGSLFMDFGSTLHIKNCSFQNNRVNLGFGGAICSSMSDLKVEENCCFKNNISIGGGAIFYSGDSMILNDCDFIGNQQIQSAQTEINGGGAIYTKGVDKKLLYIKYCRFNKNRSSRNGAGVHVGGESYVGFSECSFEDNHAKQMGDSIFNEGVVNINDSNTLKGSFVNNGKVNIKTSDFNENIISNLNEGVINK